MSIGDKIKTLRIEKELTQEQLGKYLNVGKSTISQYENNINTPDTSTLSKLADLFKVSTDYLLDRTSQLKNTFSIPLLGTIRAGLPLLAEENWTEEVEVPANLQADFALRVTGDSMSWAGIHDGDIAVLKQIDIPSHGMVVAAGKEDVQWEATLKFYVKENGKPVLRAANPTYEDIVITPGHRIVGHVVAIQKEPPTLQEYRNILLPKEIMDKQWQNTIEKATQKGMDGDSVARLIELFADMAKKF